MMTGPFAAAEEIQMLLPENQPEAQARVTARGALVVGAAVLLVAVPLGWSRAGAARRAGEANPVVPVAPIRDRS